jgi:hypothetical protein
MRRIEDFMNWMTDFDWGWWPALSLRPPKDRDIDNRVLFKISPIFGSIAGLLFLIMRIVDGTARFTFTEVIVSLLFGCLLFFILYKFTFAYFWNRRARRLRIVQTKDEPVA